MNKLLKYSEKEGSMEDLKNLQFGSRFGNFSYLVFVFAILLGSFLFFGIRRVSAATYYVDSSITDTNPASATPDFTTYNPTAFETTGGSNLVYKTIADINACSFNPGDSILFRKGHAWREQLVVPSSGSASNLITFGVYGSGDKPKLLGSNKLTNFIAFKPNTDFYGSWELGLIAGVNEGYGTGNEMSSGGSGTPGANMGWTTIAAAGSSVVDSSDLNPTIGNYSLKMDHNGTVQKNLPTTITEVYAEYIFQYTATPSDYQFGLLDSNSNFIAKLNLASPPAGKGKIYNYATSSNIAPGNTVISLDTWYRLKIHYLVDAVNGVAEWWLDSWDGFLWVAFDSASVTSINTGSTPISKIRFMARQGYSGNYMYLDEVYINKGVHDITDTTRTNSSNVVVGYNAANANPTNGFIDGKMRHVTTSFSDLGSDISNQSQFYATPTSAKLIYVHLPDLSVSNYTIEVNQPAILDDAVIISNKNHITIDGLEIGQVKNSSIRISGGSNITIQNCYLRDSGIYGIYNNGSDNFNFNNNKIYGTAGHGISVVSGSANITSGTISNNEVNQGYSPADDYVSWYVPGNDANGIVVEGASDAVHSLSGVTVSKNWVYNCGHAGLWNHYAASASWINNLVTDVMLKDEDWDKASMIIKNNLSGAGGNSAVNVYNNTFYNTAPNANHKWVIGVFATNGGTGTLTANIKNNIIGPTDVSVISDACIGLGGVIGFPLTVNLSNNLYYNCKTNRFIHNAPNNFVTVHIGKGELNNSTDPKFISSSDFHLQNISPAINAGTDVGITSDYEGNPVPSGHAPDIGAYEFQDNTATCEDNTGGLGCGKTYYIIDGTDPTAGSTMYSTPITMPEDTTDTASPVVPEEETSGEGGHGNDGGGCSLIR